MESSPQEYVANMVQVFREVSRVLRDDGTLWLNLGDSYAGSGKGGNPEAGKQSTNAGGQTVGVLYGKTGESARQAAVTNVSRRFTANHPTIKPKDLIGIPWMVAFALRDEGWYLRSDIIWSKANPMPESVTDRPTRSHEYIFLLSKSSRYFYDYEAIREPSQIDEHGRYDMASNGVRTGSAYIGQRLQDNSVKQRSARDSFKREGSKRGLAMVNQSMGTHRPNRQENGYDPAFRNKRDVWTIPTSPYAEAHFATFPPDLIKPCIMAGSRIGDTILDPFGGSGTTGQVAIELGRKAILCELNPQYVKLIESRTNVTPGML